MSNYLKVVCAGILTGKVSLLTEALGHTRKSYMKYNFWKIISSVLINNLRAVHWFENSYLWLRKGHVE